MTNETDPRVEIVARAMCLHRAMPACDCAKTTGVCRALKEDLLHECFATVHQARAILAALDAARPVETPADECPGHKLDARVWFRDSTNEWVLEISGTINDTFMICRHVEPSTTPVEEVPALPSLYPVETPADEEVAGLVERLRRHVVRRRDGTGRPAGRLVNETAPATIERQQAEIARLTAERDEARSLHNACAEARDSAGYLGTVVYCIEDLHTRATAAEAENADLRARLAKAVEALDRLVNARALEGVRSLVAGWNGEHLPEPYAVRHPPRLGASIETNCGRIYDLDEAMVAARTALAAIKEDRT